MPSNEGIKAAANLLQIYCDGAMSSALAIANGQCGDLSKKAAEDEIVANLSVVHACCRGAADILGDSAVSVTASAMEIDDDEFDGKPFNVVDTGLASVVASCGDPAVIAQLSNKREDILSFLVRLHDAVNKSNEKNIFRADQDLSMSGGNYVAITPDMTALWLRVFEAVIMYRSWVKDAPLYKQSFSANKRQAVNSSARYAKRMIERFGRGGPISTGNSAADNQANSVYWERYDLPSFSSSDRGMIQYGLIAREHAHSSTRSNICTTAGTDSSIFQECFRRLIILCGNEFESIRHDSLHYFNKLSGYGWKLEEFIEPLVQNLNTVGIKYPVAAGTLGILSCPLVLKRMVSRWPLMLSFLNAVPGTNATFAAIEEPDKRSQIGENFASFFVKYVDKWTHLPLDSVPGPKDINGVSARASAELFLKKILDEAIKMSPAVPDALSVLAPPISGQSSSNSDSSADPSSAAKGIREEIYVAFEVMHLIGHRDVQVPVEAWIWSIRQICTRRGHPIAQLGLAVLSRLAYTAAISTSLDVDEIMSAEYNGPPPQSVLPAAVIEILGNTDVWSALLEGLSSIGVKKEGDSAQWSFGIDRMLRSAEYIQQGFPRWVTSCFFLNRAASGTFRPAEAALLSSLFVICPSNGLEKSKIAAILDAARDLPATNEEETNANNTLRANLFGGLCRLTQAAYAVRNSGKEVQGSSDLDAVDSILNDFLLQQTKSISLAYCHDWCDAISFGFSTSRVKISGAGCIPLSLLQKTRSVLTTLGLTSQSAEEVDIATTAVVDGFASHAKDLLLMKGLLCADLSIVSTHRSEEFGNITSYRQHFLPSNSISSVLFSLRHPAATSDLLCTSSEVATELVKVFMDDGCSIVSPYRNVRERIVDILSYLSYAHLEHSTAELTAIHQKLGGLADLNSIAMTDDSEKSVNDLTMKNRAHNAIETALFWLEYAISNMVYRSEELMQGLLSIVLMGSGCSDIDLAKRCHNASLRTAALAARGVSVGATELSRWTAETNVSSGDIFSSITTCLTEHSKNESWRVRATAILGTSIVLYNNWMSMTMAERKACKDVFNNAFYDQKPEIQLLGRTGMTTYLSTKLVSELNQLAEAYCKNNEIFATRERKKRKAAIASGAPKDAAEKVDNVYITTIFMSASMLAAFPYDLPVFAPSLLLSLLGHINVAFFHDTVTRTVQDFKRTHQDRWDDEFKKSFSRDQLDELQGAGAQTYFT